MELTVNSRLYTNIYHNACHLLFGKKKQKQTWITLK